MADSLSGVVINEILVDPNGAANFDTDGNGTAAATDEFVELVNTSAVAVDISGWQLWDDGVGNWFTFPDDPPTILEPGAHAMVMAGLQTGGALPTGGPNDLFFDAGRGVSLINNGGDNVVVYDPGGNEFIQATFGGDALDDPVVDYPGFGAGAPAAPTQSGSGEAFGPDNDGFSIQRAPDGSDTFVNNETPTPGTTNVCFTGGTYFVSDSGPVAIENLRAGDQLMTADHGLQAIKWIWHQTWTVADLYAFPNLRPVVIMKGALGHGLPERDLAVSRQHRILVASKVAVRMFDWPEVLLPAKDLLALEGVALSERCDAVTYYHILFDQHEIVLANGVATESLFLGPETFGGIDSDAIAELCEIFAIERDQLLLMATQPARHCVAGNRARHLVDRHIKNAKPIASLEIA